MNRLVIVVCAAVAWVCPIMAQVAVPSVTAVSAVNEEMRRRSARGESIKCGSAFRMAWVVEHPGSGAGVEALLQPRPELQASQLSASGKFRIHYDSVGVNTPAMLNAGGAPVAGSAGTFVDSAASIFDQLWHRMVEELHYLPPPSDTAGGDAAYDIYVESLTVGMFGETVPEDPPLSGGGNVRWVSHMILDNDFAGLRTPGLDGLRITAAHELFHAIQIGAYGVWDTREYYFYELSSVWMETMMYPMVEDYLQDVPQYFELFPGASLTTYNTSFRGYERSVFALFLAQRYGVDALRNVWERLRQQRVLQALDAMLVSRGTSLREGFREFAVWNYFTADRANASRSYAVGDRFPRMATAVSAGWNTPTISMSYTLEALSHATWAFRTSTDTLSVLVVNTDANSADVIPIPRPTATVRMTTFDPSASAQRLTSGVWVGIDVERPEFWSSDVFSAVGRAEIRPADVRPWPSPWLLQEEADLVLPVRLADAGPVQVEFVSPSGSVITAGERTLELQRGLHVVRLPVAALRGRLGSGVYVVAVRAGADIETVKVAVVR